MTHLAPLLAARLSPAATPPEQPPSGPGGSDYTHAAAAVTAWGRGENRYWLYEPAQPTPPEAPVLLYLHGYGALEPGGYDPMLTHMARKGFTVIYPRYGWFWDPWAYENNAIDALQAALERLSGPDHVDPDLERFAISGHSLGGILSLRIAQRAGSGEEGIPLPRALILHDGAGYGTAAYPYMPLDDLSAIDPGTLLIFVIAESAPGDPSAEGVVRRGWANTPQIPREQRNALLVHSDHHGDPALLSNHLGVSGDRVDAIDWYGYWKPTVAALDLAFFGEDAEYVLGGGAQVRDMGLWSDGVPVRGSSVAEDFGY
jgi:hypothetical protein